jgi:hypothetical protein
MALPPLYKYLNVQGAKLTLRNGTFKHAKPADFNDTEDLTICSLFPEDVETALTKLARGFTDIILHHINDVPTCSSPMKERILLIQQVYRNNPTAASLVRKEMAKDDARTLYDVEAMRAKAEAFIKEINEYLQGYRVLCASTHKESEVMWCQYAEGHKSIALRIEPNIAKDSKFQLFRPVEYREARPSLYDSTFDFTGGLFGDHESQVRAIIEKIVHSKTLKWEHESEYRLAIPLRKNEEPWNTLKYHPEEITELYLGRSMENSDMEEIIDLAKSLNPNIAIFRSTRDTQGKIVFTRDERGSEAPWENGVP